MGLDTKTYWLTERQSQCDFDFKGVNTEAEEATALAAVTRKGLVKREQAEKS
jgi:hypothetical protein